MLTELIKKYREIILYLFFGVLTTSVSIFVYYFCTKFFFDANNPLDLQLANVISWIISVAFSYVTNKLFVFESHGNVIHEMIKFYSARLGTLVIDMALMYLLVSLMSLPDLPIKIAVQFVVIVSNYVLSKLLVFKEKNK